jgi:hypothetical protein
MSTSCYFRKLLETGSWKFVVVVVVVVVVRKREVEDREQENESVSEVHLYLPATAINNDQIPGGKLRGSAEKVFSPQFVQVCPSEWAGAAKFVWQKQPWITALGWC